jgi:hypothetical protein
MRIINDDSRWPLLSDGIWKSLVGIVDHKKAPTLERKLSKHRGFAHAGLSDHHHVTCHQPKGIELSVSSH